MKSLPRFLISTKVLWCAPALTATSAVVRADETASQSTLPRTFRTPLAQRLQKYRGERTTPIEALSLRNRTPKSESIRPISTLLPVITHDSLVSETTTLGNNWRFRSERHADEKAARWTHGERVAEAWKLGVDAPVEHPWGTLKVSANFEGAGGGVATDAASAAAGDKRGGAVAVQQDVKLGSISGSTKIAVSQTENRDATPILTNAPGAQNQAAEGSANLRWQMKPNLALTTSHQSRIDRRSAWNANPDAIDRNFATRNQSQVGLEWKPSKTYSISLGAGQTRLGTDARRDGGNIPTSLRDEERATLGLQRRTGGGAWGVSFARQSWEENVRNSDNREADSVSLHGERKLLPWLSLRGSWRLSGEDNYLSSRLNEQAQREAEAQIQSRLGQFAFRYADSSQSQSTFDGNTLGEGGAREYGLRYNVGASSGLGLSMEYSVREERAGQNTNNYRVGITYR